MIRSIEDISERIKKQETNWEQYGDVRAVYHDGRVLFNYTAQCQYKPPHAWNWFEINARGLIFDANTGDILARPFRKFWNYGQILPPQDSQLVSVTEKMDGSLGVMYWYRGDPYIATRGSFTSDQALWATNYLREWVDVEYLRDENEELTYLFEIIYPENRVVVDYAELEGLWLIGARNMQYGWELYESQLDGIAQTEGTIYRPVLYRMDDIQETMQAVAAMNANQEGFVLRYSDNERYKVKSEAYMLAHRIMTGCSFNRVLDAVAQGKYEEMIEGVPDEFLGTVKTYREEIESESVAIESEIDRELQLAPEGDRKQFALWVQENHPKNKWSYFFARKDGKDLRSIIYKQAFKDRENQYLGENIDQTDL